MSVKLRYVLILLIIFLPLFSLRLVYRSRPGFQIGDKIRIRAVLTQEPQQYAYYQQFSLQSIKVRAPLDLSLHYGDKLEVVGQAQKGPKSYYLTNPQIKKMTANAGLRTRLFKLRQKLEQNIARVLPEPQASLLSGMVLGVQKKLDVDFYQNLINSGLLHLVVASGMNITLLTGGLADILAYIFQRKPAILLSICIIYLYCLLAGFTPPIIRAGLMVSTVYLSQFFGRASTAWWTLLLTACLMLIINPLLIVDTGFQLSFMATLGLITLAPRIEFKLRRFPKLAVPLAETLAASLATAPILIFTFGRFNPLIILSNLGVLWLVEYIMYLGIVLIVSSLIFPPLTQVISWLAWMPLTYLSLVINVFGQIL